MSEQLGDLERIAQLAPRIFESLGRTPREFDNP
jgi:hypothetical protein